MPVTLTFVDTDKPLKLENHVMQRCAILAHKTYIFDSIDNYSHQTDHGKLPTEPGRLFYL